MSPGLDSFVAVLALVLIGVIGTLAFRRLRSKPRFPYLGRPLSDNDFAVLAAKPGWRAQQLSVESGVVLRGLLREPSTPASPWIVFFNGNSSTMLDEGQRMLEALCAPHGWGGVVWAYRGFDSSGGTPSAAALEADGFKAYSALLQERKLSPGAVHLVGFSLGTGIAVAVAALAQQQPPASLALLAPFTVFYMGERTQLRLNRWETRKWLDRIASPTLVLHGVRDTTLKIEEGRAVAQALGSRATLIEFPKLGHGGLFLDPGVQEAMSRFISGHTTRAGS